MIKAAYIVPHPPLIVPEVGKGDEKAIKRTIDAYHQVAKEIAELKPKTIIISSPHGITYRDYFHVSPYESFQGNFEQYGGKEVEAFPINDLDLVHEIEKIAKKVDFPAGTLGAKYTLLDHGVLVPLYFINHYYSDYKVVLLSPSGFDHNKHYEMGKLVQSVIKENHDVVYIASGDLSHKLTEDGPYGYVEQGPLFDKEVVNALEKADFLKLLELSPAACYKVAECGINSFTMMAGFLDGYQMDSELLSYEGPFGVGYAVLKYSNLSKNPSRSFDVIYQGIIDNSIKELRKKEDPYVSLARKALELYVSKNYTISVDNSFPDELLKNKAGVFVSLHLNDRLRGCIGTVVPTKNNIAEEIVENAISAGTRDYRFSKVKSHELENIEYSVDVLLPPEPIDSSDKLDITIYGVIVSSGHKTGLLLPNIDGIDNVEEQIEVAKRKAGIDDYEKYKLHRFKVIRHH